MRKYRWQEKSSWLWTCSHLVSKEAWGRHKGRHSNNELRAASDGRGRTFSTKGCSLRLPRAGESQGQGQTDHGRYKKSTVLILSGDWASERGMTLRLRTITNKKVKCVGDSLRSGTTQEMRVSVSRTSAIVGNLRKRISDRLLFLLSFSEMRHCTDI